MEEKEELLAIDAPEKRIGTLTPVSIETRGEGDQKRDYIVGCAIKYNVRSQLLGWFYEIIDERALDTTDVSDVVGLFNHDSNIILGRTGAGTLILEKRAGDGCYFMIPFDELDPDHVRVRRKIEKKEVVGCSFQFTIAREGTRWSMDPETEIDIRTVTNIAKLYDVGPVTFPAYTQTNTGIDKRSMDAIRAERDAAKREAIPPLEDPNQQQESKTDEDASASVAAELDMLAMELEL
ncbi:HK97 family phage prohead protease [Larkinella ripae]